MPYPDYLTPTTPKIIFFTDFDGTITLQDTNDYITAHYGCGEPRLKEITHLIATEKLSFRDGFQQEVNSWNLPLPEVIEILKSNIKLDPHFTTFMKWARENGVPVVVLSSGMIPVISALLNHLVGSELIHDVEIVANDAQLVPPGNSLDKADGWNIQFHDDSDFGHNKALAIRPYAEHISQHISSESEKPTLLYAGDGVSDLSAARETDLLFAKAGKDLVGYCEREGIPFTTFEDWGDILRETREIFEGRKSVRKVAEEGLKRHRTNSFG